MLHTDEAKLEHRQATNGAAIQIGEHLHRQGNVQADRHRAPERRVLEQHPEAPPTDLGPQQFAAHPVIRALDKEVANARAQKTDHGFEHGALATAAAPHYRENTASVYVE
jgi:hypothetical protein